MISLEQPQMRTRMFARAIGPFFAIVPTIIAIRSSYMQTLFTEFKANPMWPWLFGAILLLFGLVIIAFHQCWRSPAAIIVSLIGWFLAIRGILLLTVPQAYNAAGNAIYSSGAIAAVRVSAICLGLAGLYLTYIGWKPQAPTPKTVTNTTQDHPHATGSN
jgi:hypothetical protein